MGLEATQGSHYWARVIGSYGHEVRLIAPQFVKPYLKGQKNDVSRELFASLYEELCALDKRIEATEERIQRVFVGKERCQKIATVEGVGPVTARRSWRPSQMPECSATGGSWRHGWVWCLGSIRAETSSACSESPSEVIRTSECY